MTKEEYTQKAATLQTKLDIIQFFGVPTDKTKIRRER